ncbi:alpha/beta-hydrolase [Clavulina sp. PMI_390]|nr:alpha/beta-hydrolase [Clavulina sp. PMI_390]
MTSYLPSLSSLAKYSFYTSLSFLSLAAGTLFFGQGYLIYPANIPPGSRQTVSTPQDYGLPYEDLELITSDSVKIKAYLILQRPNDSGTNIFHNSEQATIMQDDKFASTRPTVLFFHANAGNVGHRIPLARMFYHHARCNVLMISYRGYGKSEGTASQKGIQRDSQAALDYVLSHPQLQNTKLIFYGQSLGGAVAIDLASRNPTRPSALILENTFTSIPDMAAKVLPLTKPFLWLCTEPWNSLKALESIDPSTSILMMSGLRDELVPPSQMRQLWEAVTAKSKKGRVWCEFPQGTHNDTCIQPQYWVKVADFVDNL